LSAADEFQDKLAAARQDPQRRDQLLQSYARSHGLVLQQLFETHLSSQQAMGRLEDLRNVNQVRWAGAVSGSVLSILPAVPGLLAPGMVAVTAHALVMPTFWEGATTNPVADEKTAASMKQIDQWYSATLGNMVVRMQDGGGFAGTTAEASGWQDRHQVPADARFTDGQGRVVDPSTMTEPQRAAFGRWLSDPENEGVRLEMVRMFTAVDAAGGRPGD
jgi:hypothetical protein